MTQRLWLCLLVAVTIGAFPQPATAQPPRLSHVPIPGGVVPSVADKYLTDRLQQAETGDQVRRLLTELAKDPEKFGIQDEKRKDKLTAAVARAGAEPEKALEDPEVQKILAEAAEKFKGRMPTDAGERERLQKFIDNFVPAGGPGAEFNPSAPPAAPGQPISSGPPPGTGPSPPSPMTPPGSGGAPPAISPPSSAAPPPGSALKDSVGKMAKALSESPLGDSPALNRMVVNLGRVKAPSGAEGFDWDKHITGLEGRLADVGTRLPKFSWPKVDFAQPRGGRGGAQAVADDRDGGSGRIFLVLLGGLAAGLLAWGALRRPGVGLLGRGGDGGWRLGPWPVRPEAVSTRDDLVRAFEYLALLRLGLAARSRNHREIAARLGESDGIHRAAADRLAGLYEQARYAPPDEALPDADLAGARADLSLLAGARAA